MYKLKFIGMYCISIVLIIVIMCGFLLQSPAEKTVVLQKQQPTKTIIKTVYVKQKNNDNIKDLTSDSFNTAFTAIQQKVNELNTRIQKQQDSIDLLRRVSVRINKPDVNKTNSEVAELKKQIKFYDWALRSQVAVTNTLTKENNNLKVRIKESVTN